MRTSATARFSMSRPRLRAEVLVKKDVRGLDLPRKDPFGRSKEKKNAKKAKEKEEKKAPKAEK